MTEKRFQYIRGKYSHGVHDTVKDGEYKKGYRTTYDDFDLDKLTDELNIRENKIKQLEEENEQLKYALNQRTTQCDKYYEENEQLKQFPVKLDNRIQKLEEDLKALKEMETDDLNPQAIEDVAIVIGMSLNALKEFKKELKGDAE